MSCCCRVFPPHCSGSQSPGLPGQDPPANRAPPPPHPLPGLCLFKSILLSDPVTATWVHSPARGPCQPPQALPTSGKPPFHSPPAPGPFPRSSKHHLLPLPELPLGTKVRLPVLEEKKKKYGVPLQTGISDKQHFFFLVQSCPQQYLNSQPQLSVSNVVQYLGPNYPKQIFVVYPQFKFNGRPAFYLVT